MTNEYMRGEDKLLKKQPHGDDIDIDALVEAYADVKSGMEMTSQLFTKMHKEKRNGMSFMKILHSEKMSSFIPQMLLMSAGA